MQLDALQNVGGASALEDLWWCGETCVPVRWLPRVAPWVGLEADDYPTTLAHPFHRVFQLTAVYFCGRRNWAPRTIRGPDVNPSERRVQLSGSPPIFFKPQSFLDCSVDVLTHCEMKGNWSMAFLIGSRGVPAASNPPSLDDCPQHSQNQFFLHMGAK